MNAIKSLFLELFLALWATDALSAFIPSFMGSLGSSQSGGSGAGSSFTPSQFGTTGGESFGSSGSNASQIGGSHGFSTGWAFTNFRVNNKDSSYNNANGAGSSTQGVATSHGLGLFGGFGLFGSGNTSSSSKAEMNSRAQTIWRPDSPYGPSGAVAAGGGTAGSTADSYSFGPKFLNLAWTQSNVNTNIKTFGNDNGSGSTGSVIGSSNGFALFGSSSSNTAVNMGGEARHAGQFGASTASAGGRGQAGGNSGAGLSNFLGLSSSNVKITKDYFAGNGRSSSRSSTSGSNLSGGLFG